MQNNFSINYKDYDCIIGYRADDSYFACAQDFINGTISYRQLNNAMHLGKLGQQFVLKSKKAFDRIAFIEAEAVQSAEWFSKNRDNAARAEYFNIDRINSNDIFMPQILTEEMKSDDPRLQ